jgi:hypothetical protein
MQPPYGRDCYVDMTEEVLPSPAEVVPAWEAFARDYVETGIPCAIVIRASPDVVLFLDEGAARLGGYFEIEDQATVPPSPLEEITFREAIMENKRCLELSTTSTALFRTFFFMLGDLASGIVTDGEDAIVSLARSLRNWYAILRHPETLSEERQLGLFGELWLLRRLLGTMGHAAVKSWTGPRRQSHDFRLATIEFEVKTTAGSQRLHTINGLDQLVPSPGFSLFILSLQVTHGGTGGWTLAEFIAETAASLRHEAEATREFIELLELAGYRQKDAALYTRRRRLLGPPLLVCVADGCPRLTTDALAALPLSFSTERIRDVTYQIDVAGMGSFDGDEEFLAILPVVRKKMGEPTDV